MTKYLNNEDFDHSTAQSVGGLTGSERVKLQGHNYQLKPSILDNSFIRKTKAGSMDRENFGEMISAAVSRAVTGSDQPGNPELVPEVALVYDDGKKKDKASGEIVKVREARVKVASKYLNNVQGNLNEYAEKQGIEIKGAFVKVSTNPMAQGAGLDLSGNGEDKKILRKDLAIALAVSAFSGDHDINPGNMLALKDAEGRMRIARIDFGHAFNDLLNAPKQFGGQLRNKENQVLDFFNRENVAHVIESHKRSKLWSSYSGIVPSDELASALKEIADSNRVQDGLNNAKASFGALIDELNKDPVANKKTLDHIKNSLVTISNNVSDNKLDGKKLTAEQALNQVFDNLGKYYEQNQNQVRDVAKLVQMQANIDKVIMAKKDGKEPDTNLIESINKAYEELKTTPGIGLKNGKGIEWAKVTDGVPAFKGSLDHYIELRGRGFGVEVKGMKDLAPKASIQVTDEYTLVAKFLKESVETYAKEPQPVDKKKLEQKFNDLLLKTVTSHEQTEVVIAMKENMGHYVNHMNKEMKHLHHEKLSHYSRKEDTLKSKAMHSAILDSSFHKASQSLANQGEKWFDKSANTKWKKAEKLFDFLGMKETATWCHKKNEQEKLKAAAKSIGIPIMKNIKTEVTSKATLVTKKPQQQTTR
jgi:hypothetical protein